MSFLNNNLSILRESTVIMVNVLVKIVKKLVQSMVIGAVGVILLNVLVLAEGVLERDIEVAIIRRNFLRKNIIIILLIKINRFRPRNGGKYCVGDRVLYESCNTQVIRMN